MFIQAIREVLSPVPLRVDRRSPLAEENTSAHTSGGRGRKPWGKCAREERVRQTRGWLVGGLMVSWLLGASSTAADSVCQEAQEILGIGLRPAGEETHPAAPSLLITEV